MAPYQQSTGLPDSSDEVLRLVVNYKGLAAHSIAGMRNEFGTTKVVAIDYWTDVTVHDTESDSTGSSIVSFVSLCF